MSTIELSRTAQILNGLPNHTNDLAKFESKYGFWCQSEAVFIEASRAEIAIVKYRYRNRDTAEIAVSHNLHTDAIGRLQWQVRTEKAEAQVNRLYPLVRYQRVELHEAKLIDNREYADLAGNSYHLDTYDELRGRADAAEKVLVNFKAEMLAGLKEAYGQSDWQNIHNIIQELKAE